MRICSSQNLLHSFETLVLYSIKSLTIWKSDPIQAKDFYFLETLAQKISTLNWISLPGWLTHSHCQAKRVSTHSKTLCLPLVDFNTFKKIKDSSHTGYVQNEHTAYCILHSTRNLKLNPQKDQWPCWKCKRTMRCVVFYAVHVLYITIN